MTQSEAHIVGEVESISFRSSESGWTVLQLLTEQGEQHTVTGIFGSIRTGDYYTLQGNWVNHSQHGKQFKSQAAQPTLPKTQEGLIRYLASESVAGIGPVLARRIVEHFGDSTIKVLDQEPDRLLEVESIGEKKASSIIRSWKECQGLREAELFLCTLELSPGLRAKIIRTYGQNTIAHLQENPYRICYEITGIGFQAADQIGKSLGIDPLSNNRLAAACVYTLKLSEEQGHCYLTHTQLCTGLAQHLSLSIESIEENITQILADLNERGSIFTDLSNHGERHYLLDLFMHEEALSNRLKLLLSEPLDVDLKRIENWLQVYSQKLSSPLSEKQLASVKEAVSSKVFILTGGPGVGKTTTANAILRLLKAMGRSVSLAAPTGRAAQRLLEVTGIEAKTIHRLLEWAPFEKGFSRGLDNPLNAQVIVVDEASMLDLPLARALLDSVPLSSQVIFIGDVDQLPSVGPGNVLKDLLTCGKIPSVTLKEIFRQAASSHIVRIAHAINSGQAAEFIDADEVDCHFIHASHTNDITSIIRTLVTETLPQKGGYDAIRDIQVLTPMNRGDLGTIALNSLLQQSLNPATDEISSTKVGDTHFRAGDKVIQVSNNYELNVFNGDIGIVSHAGMSGGRILVSFAGRDVSYSKEDCEHLKLAYAVTIHKSQGSEFPVVVIPISMQHYIMLQRNLIYTALTRAKRLAIFVGMKRALDHSIDTQTAQKRQTSLVEKLITIDSEPLRN